MTTLELYAEERRSGLATTPEKPESSMPIVQKPSVPIDDASAFEPVRNPTKSNHLWIWVVNGALFCVLAFMMWKVYERETGQKLDFMAAVIDAVRPGLNCQSYTKESETRLMLHGCTLKFFAGKQRQPNDVLITKP